MLAQASENEHLEAIFKDLLDDDGSEICIRPAQNYVPLDSECSFYDVAQVALSRGEVAIGHHLQGAVDESGRGMGGIIINPTKSDTLRYGAGDRIVVLAHQ